MDDRTPEDVDAAADAGFAVDSNVLDDILARMDQLEFTVALAVGYQEEPGFQPQIDEDEGEGPQAHDVLFPDYLDSGDTQRSLCLDGNGRIGLYDFSTPGSTLPGNDDFVLVRIEAGGAHVGYTSKSQLADWIESEIDITQTIEYETNITNAVVANISEIVGSIDHGGLAGLTDDDHAQYLLLAGGAARNKMSGAIGDAGGAASIDPDGRILSGVGWNVSDTTDATNTISGALVVSGGGGFAKTLWAEKLEAADSIHAVGTLVAEGSIRTNELFNCSGFDGVTNASPLYLMTADMQFVGPYRLAGGLIAEF